MDRVNRDQAIRFSRVFQFTPNLDVVEEFAKQGLPTLGRDFIATVGAWRNRVEDLDVHGVKLIWTRHLPGTRFGGLGGTFRLYNKWGNRLRENMRFPGLDRAAIFKRVGRFKANHGLVASLRKVSHGAGFLNPGIPGDRGATATTLDFQCSPSSGIV